MTYFLNFGTTSISRERFELETSNLACRLTTGDTNEKQCKIRSKRVGKGSRDLLLIFWNPYISPERLKLENSNLVRQSKMPIAVTSNRYNSNMADVRFLKLEVVLTQPWFELSYQNLVWR